jgi:hypothetical protein
VNDLMQEYRSKSGRVHNQGNFYRECSKLVTQGLIAQDPNPPDADQRRIPYRITRDGCRDFDDWLLDEAVPRGGCLEAWLMFAGMLGVADRLRMLDGVREQLWADMKALGRMRDRIIARAPRTSPRSYQPAIFLTLRRIELVSAEIEFLDKLRAEFEQMPPGSLIVSGRCTGDDDARVRPRPVEHLPKSRPSSKL